MRKRSISIPIRVTEKELTTIDTKATKAGMNRTDYLIACAEADDRAKYLFRNHFLRRLRKVDGIAPSKHNEEI